MNDLDINPDHDGVRHLNIWTRAATQLGKDLSHFTGLSINHPQYGYFRTLEGFWHWLSTGKQHDIFRSLDGFPAKMEIRNGRYERVSVNNFEEEIRKAHVLRFEQHPFLKEAFMESTLPFEHYFVQNAVVNTLDQLRWIPRMLEDLRQEIQLNKVFDKKYLNDIGDAPSPQSFHIEDDMKIL